MASIAPGGGFGKYPHAVEEGERVRTALGIHSSYAQGLQTKAGGLEKQFRAQGFEVPPPQALNPSIRAESNLSEGSLGFSARRRPCQQALSAALACSQRACIREPDLVRRVWTNICWARGFRIWSTPTWPKPWGGYPGRLRCSTALHPTPVPPPTTQASEPTLPSCRQKVAPALLGSF